MSSTFIVFGSIVVIVGMVLTFQLLTLIIDKKKGGQTRSHRRHQPGTPDGQAWQELSERAEVLNQRLQNLEEILQQEKERENVQ